MSWHRAAPRRFWCRALFLTLFAPALLGLVMAPVVARSPDRATTATPALDSSQEQRDQALARLGVDRWHQAGQRGQGIKVAVLDSGFRDYRSLLGKALPAKVTGRSFRRDGDLEARDSQHGVLCAEVIHAVAPDAELLLVNWEPDRPETFLQAALWAREQGARVASCSLIMPSWSDGEGGGLINQALAKIVGSEVLCFASAGNIAQRHWGGPIRRDADGYHQWTDGNRNNLLTPWGTERVSVELYGPRCQGLELQVVETGTGTMIGKCCATCEGSASGCPCAVVRFLPQSGMRFAVRVRCDPTMVSDKSDPFHLVALGSGLQYATAAGSIPCPADGPGVLAVGAVDDAGQRMSYSSCGPNSLLPKPDFVAEVPFPSALRERPFAGTSAAAPQAAALAALVWGRHPTWTAAQVKEVLGRAARDLGPLGHDCQTGHGLLRAPSATR
jgi:subtilisin family serine protease